MTDMEPAEPSATDAPAEPEQTNPTDTVEFWKQKAREQEKRAKANADAAKRLSEIEEAQKSEAEKAADRIAKAEQAAAEAEARVLRRDIALEFRLERSDADLLDNLADEDSMRKLAARLSEQTEARKRQGNHAPREGVHTPDPPEDEMRAFTRALFQGAD